MRDLADLSAIDLWQKYQYGLISIQEYQEIQEEIFIRLKELDSLNEKTNSPTKN